MQVIKRAVMPDGTKIQIEDWHDNYSFIARRGTVAAYPVSKATIPGSFEPSAGVKFRVSFDFDHESDAEQAFNKLVSGEAQLRDFIERMNNPKHAPCL